MPDPSGNADTYPDATASTAVTLATTATAFGGHDAVEVDVDDRARRRGSAAACVECTHRVVERLVAARRDRHRRRPVDARDVDDHVAVAVRQDVDRAALAELHRDEVGDRRVERA